jgi:hypothetical protein
MTRPTNAAIVDHKGRKWNPFDTKEARRGYVTYTEQQGEIHVPYGTDPVSLMVQAHELAHVRYTSKVWPDATRALRRLTELAGTTSAIVGYAEDMRITALAGRLGIKTLFVPGDTLDQPLIDQWVESFVKGGIPEKRAKRAARFILTEHTSVLKTLGLTPDSLQDKANAERYIVHNAGLLHKLLTKGDEPSDGDKGTPEKSDKADGKGQAEKSESKPKADKADKGEAEDKPAEEADKPEDKAKGDDSEQDDSGDDSEDGDEQAEDGSGTGDDEADSDSDSDSEGDSDSPEGEEADPQPSKGDKPGDGGDVDGEIDLSEVTLPDPKQTMLAGVPAPVDEQKLTQEFQHTLDTADWVPVLKIDRMPLVRRAAQARNRGRKLSEVGVALGSAYDAVSPNERRPFTAKRKGGAGGLTVVVDCSGSMSINPAQLEHLLLKYPQGVVVTYSSVVSRYGAANNRAVVRVIASHGRVAATDDFRDYTAGGNGCDGPMLEWLAKQSGEKVWVCDGVITGKGDEMVVHSHQARNAWLKAHRIKQFTTLGGYLESLG